MASPVETVSSANTEGPGSPWRASVGVSRIWRRSFDGAMVPLTCLARANPRVLRRNLLRQRLISADVPGRSTREMLRRGAAIGPAAG